MSFGNLVGCLHLLAHETLYPDRPFHNFNASKSVELSTLSTHNFSIDGYCGSKIMKVPVGIGGRRRGFRLLDCEDWSVIIQVFFWLYGSLSLGWWGRRPRRQRQLSQKGRDRRSGIKDEWRGFLLQKQGDRCSKINIGFYDSWVFHSNTVLKWADR